MTTATRTMLACLLLGALMLIVGHGVQAASPATAVSIAAADDEPWPHCAGCIP